jgi:hypothetical protein
MPPKEPNDWIFSQEEFENFYSSWPLNFVGMMEDVKNLSENQLKQLFDQQKLLEDAQKSSGMLPFNIIPWEIDAGNGYSYTSLYYNEKAPVELPKTEVQNTIPVKETKQEEPSKENSIFTKLDFEKDIE